MEAEGILNKIEERCAAEVAAIRDDSIKRADALSARIIADAHAKADALTAGAKREADAIAVGAHMNADLDARKASLRSKRDILAAAFTRAKEELCSLSLAERAELIRKLTLSECMEGNVTLTVAECDLAAVTGMLKELEASLTAKYGTPCLLKAVMGRLDGGVIFNTDKCDIDASYDMLLRTAQETREADIARILFNN